MSNITPFLPPLDSMWRLTEDVPMPRHVLTFYKSDIGQSYNVALQARDWPEWQQRRGHAPYSDWSDEDRLAYDEWTKQVMEEHNIKLPKGTVIVFDRYHISHSGEDQVTVRILASSDMRIHPRKQGGKGKGKLRMYLKLEDINNFGVLEQVDDLA